MKVNNFTSVLLSIVLTISLCVSFVPVWAYGEPSLDTDSEGVCSHQHDESCGYKDGVEGSCEHVHDESCGYFTKADSLSSDTDNDVADSDTIDAAFENSDLSRSVASWEWVDDQQVLNESDGAWGLGLAGASESAPATRDTLKDLLPSQVNATMANGEKKTLDITWDLSSIPEEGASQGDYQVSASLSDTSYSLADSVSPLAVTVQVGGAESYNLTLPSGTPPYSDHIVNGVSPNGTTINLFDYWLTDQLASDNSDPPSDIQNQGINKDHALLFSETEEGNGTHGLERVNLPLGES